MTRENGTKRGSIRFVLLYEQTGIASYLLRRSMSMIITSAVPPSAEPSTVSMSLPGVQYEEINHPP